jgi:hypothetical protein
MENEKKLCPFHENMFRNLQILVDEISEPKTQTLILEHSNLSLEISEIVDRLIILHFKLGLYDPRGERWAIDNG